MAFLTREQVLARKKKLKTEAVTLPDGEGEVLVRELKAGERVRLAAQAQGRDGKPAGAQDASIRVVVLCAVNPDGTPLFRSEDDAELAELSGADVEHLAAAIGRLSGLAPAAVEDAAKN
jgi:hypothetical protein